ncbi:MAG: putative IIA-like nitrogen-regulatory protein PtsN, partial [Verrucomicrobiaceae bacterium]|nr:putative IIA-like nitrogen-regulatory protein PtsN [Verrucomicrobiaceae bacterium]
VHLIVMYYVPDAQKNAYLKEISSLAKAIQTVPSMQELASLEELGDVRHRLLDAISIAMESMTPDARARMIQLDVKHATTAQEEDKSPVSVELAHHVFPVQIITAPGCKPLALAQDAELVQLLESSPELLAGLDQQGRADCKGYYVVLRSITRFQLDRTVHDCIAMPVGGR